MCSSASESWAPSRGRVPSIRRSTAICVVAASALTATLGLAAAAGAAPLVAACGHTISARANLVLQNDLGPCATDGIVITGNNVRLDLNGHTLLGMPKSIDADGNVTGTGEGAGIRIVGARGATVTDSKHGTAAAGRISDFDAGVALLPTAGAGNASFNTVMNLNLTGNEGNITNGPEDDPTISDFDEGMRLINADHNTVKGNVVTANSRGIGVDDGANFNTITNNQINDNNGGGVGLLTDAVGNVISSNTISRNAFGGVSASFNNRANVIRGNVMTSNNAFGVILGFKTSDNTVQNNKITDSKFAGIVVGGSGTRVIGNTVIGSGQRADATGFLACEPVGFVDCGGIQVGGGDLPDFPVDNVTVSENSVSGSKGGGIRVNCTRDDSVVADQVPCADYDQNDKIVGNHVSGNGTGAPVICDASCFIAPFGWNGFVIGSFDLLDGNNSINDAATTPNGLAADCGHNTWSDNDEDGLATGFPDCTEG